MQHQGNNKGESSHSNNCEDLSLPSLSSPLMEKPCENCQLTADVLGIISNKLDIDDLFSFGSVCHDWRASFTKLWGPFISSQAPLVIQMTKPPNGAVTFYSISEGDSKEPNRDVPAFYSISDGRSYNTELPYLPGELCYSRLYYVGFSSGYIILVSKTDSTLFLLNPFERKMLQIPELPKTQDGRLRKCLHAMLVFAVDSEEFAIMVICAPHSSLLVYQSRNSCWQHYMDGISFKIVDIVALHRTLYAIDSFGRIGVLSLNAPRVKFLQFSNKPRSSIFCARFVVCDGKLWVINRTFCCRSQSNLQIYRIDFSAMEWVKVETLGDRALFVNFETKYHALSNPGRWGYESNSIYYIQDITIVKEYSLDNNLGNSVLDSTGVEDDDDDDEDDDDELKPYYVDWCFRNHRYEVDYSLDD